MFVCCLPAMRPVRLPSHLSGCSSHLSVYVCSISVCTVRFSDSLYRLVVRLLVHSGCCFGRRVPSSPSLFGPSDCLAIDLSVFGESLFGCVCPVRLWYIQSCLFRAVRFSCGCRCHIHRCYSSRWFSGHHLSGLFQPIVQFGPSFVRPHIHPCRFFFFLFLFMCLCGCLIP